MAKRATIKDIARRAGVSIGSVHYALSGKNGVSDETRARICSIARELSYRANAAAVALKKKPLRIAAALPKPARNYRFYFSYVWDGIRDFAGAGDRDIEIVEMPYSSVTAGVKEAMARHGEFDGLLTRGHMSDGMPALLGELSRRDIPVVFIGDDLPGVQRLCCVQPNYVIIGRTMAELIVRQVRTTGSVLLCAGDCGLPSHGLIVQGFRDYLRDNGSRLKVVCVDTDLMDPGTLKASLLQAMAEKSLVACASVSSYCSVILGDALVASGKAGRIPAIGSDLFRESAKLLRDGVFTNLVHKHPHSQAFVATRVLFEYLFHGSKPPFGNIFMGSDVIFQSSLPLYDLKGRNDGYLDSVSRSTGSAAS